MARRIEEIALISERTPDDELRARAARDVETLDLHAHFPARSAIYPSAAVAAAADVSDTGRASPDTRVGSSKDKTAGAITSSVYSFALRRPLFMGYLRRESLGAALSIRTPRGVVSAREIDLPVGRDTKAS